MSRIVFNLRRDIPWYRTDKPGLRYVLGDTLEKALNDTCFASMEIDARATGEQRTRWGPGLTPTALLDFVGRFRNLPGRTYPDENVRAGLHSFLFAERYFDAYLAAALARDVAANEQTEILIRGDSSSLPLIVNVPWELADGVPTLPGGAASQAALFGTMGSLGLARIVVGSNARLHPTDERLRVLYCISEPQGLEPIQAPKFREAIENALSERAGMLSYRPVTGGDFRPTFNQLKAAIEETRPHVLIAVCHGQTVGGLPQLCFEEWHPVTSLADALAQNEKAFLIFLIACDQARLDEHPAAQSGALTFLERGILSVVAMQSSVDAVLAQEFLGTTLDWFFQSGKIALAVAEGRKSMAPTQADVDSRVDWSFPALFLTEDAQLHTHKLTRIIQGYFPALDEMRRRLPRPHIYLERSQTVDEPLREFLRAEVSGFREVIGGSGTGKTTALLRACRLILDRAVEMRDTSGRPLLYIDFARYTEPPRTIQSLAEIVHKQSDEIQSNVASTPLLNWASPRGTDGEGRADDLTRQLLRLIDVNRMVLVLDNLQEDNEPFWAEFYAQAAGLNHSLIIRAGETALGPDTGSLLLLPFSREETTEYVESYAPQRAADADLWYEKTGGLPGLLELLRRADRGVGEDNLMAPLGITSNLSQSDRMILYMLANLPNGVDLELASVYVSARSRDLLALAQRGLLLRESRFELTSTWFRLPQMVMQSLFGDIEPKAEAATLLTERFVDQMTSEDTQVIDHCIELAKKPGGIDFLQDIHQIFISLAYWDKAHALPLLLHEYLFSRGRWFEAYRLWERLLSQSSFEETHAHEWLKLAKAAHVLGMGGNAEEFVAKAEQRGLAALDEIDSLILRAALIKDSGETGRADEVTEIYDQILRNITASLGNASVGEGPDSLDLEQRLALTIYNHALHRRFWLMDPLGALSDLEQARAEFTRLGMERMRALADCEWVDTQLDWLEHELCWPEMLDQLLKANATFASGENSPGDRAFCYYQLARYYRRRPPATPEEANQNIVKACDAYRRASEQACLAGDLRQRAIADGHVVEVRWSHLRELDEEEATRQLDNVIDILKTFEGDAWSTRVLRDMLLLRAQTARNVRSDSVLSDYEQAWHVARLGPLHPSVRTDARRAARILFEYLQELGRSGRDLDGIEVSVVAQEFVEQWLGRAVDAENYRSWIDELGRFSIGPGEYYGQPAR